MAWKRHPSAVVVVVVVMRPYHDTARSDIAPGL